MNTHTGTLICGVDDVTQAADAADIGRALATRLGLRLVLVSVLDGVPEGTHESLTARQRQAGASGRSTRSRATSETGRRGGSCSAIRPRRSRRSRPRKAPT